MSMPGNARGKETRAIQKISKILSRLDPDAAARVASWAAGAFGADTVAERADQTVPQRADPPEDTPRLRAVQEDENVAARIKAVQAAKSRVPPKPAPRRISQITAPAENTTAAPAPASPAAAVTNAAPGGEEPPTGAKAEHAATRAPDPDSDKPSFMQTQFRMKIGKEILEQEKEKARS